MFFGRNNLTVHGRLLGRNLFYFQGTQVDGVDLLIACRNVIDLLFYGIVLIAVLRIGAVEDHLAPNERIVVKIETHVTSFPSCKFDNLMAS
jgi:hypothetical protein